MNNYQKFIHLSRYARWNEETGKRESWRETVDRYCAYFKGTYPQFPDKQVGDAIENLEVMPSMRCLMTAGKALERDQIAGYNCSFLAIDHPRAFDEVMYILMCGTGVGFSVERQFINKLPEIAEDFHSTDTTITAADSRQGWASSYRELISLLYSGRLPKWDLSKLRAAGARLKTFGGRSSGPEPLNDLFKFTTDTFKRAAGRKLNSLECHDIVCKIADIVVVGGVRRSALISLSNLTDERMRGAKSGQWWIESQQRALANNSAAYTEKPDIGIFMKEWHSLYESKSGERGIFNRVGAIKKVKENGRREWEGIDFGTNPCGEILLRPAGLCNLSEVVVRPDDDLASLKAKVEVAAIIGTFQSTLTNFRYVRPIWKKNAEEERLLGVSFTGIMDHLILCDSSNPITPIWLEELKKHAVETNKTWAKELGINPSVAVTTLKPSGTVSQLVDSASGIHPRYSKFYIRTVRGDKKDPLSKFLKDVGVPCEDDVTNASNEIFSFPQEAPDHAVFRNDINAIEQLEHYLIFRKHWCEHNPSITVYVKEDEWLKVGAWVYEHFDEIGGVSFLPHTDHVYRQAPYQEIDEEAYKVWQTKVPEIDWNLLAGYESADTTSIQPELACSAGVCEL